MFNSITKDEIITQFTEGSVNLYDSVKDDNSVDDAMKSDDIQRVREIVRKMQSIMIASIPTGIAIPKVAMYVTGSGIDDISIVNVKITNTVSSENNFAFSTSVVKGNASEKIFDFMVNVYTSLIIDELICENLDKVNDVLFQAISEAGIDYDIKIVSSLGNEGKKIASITDDSVIFVADENKVFELDDIIVLLNEPTDLVTEEIIQEQYNTLVEDIGVAQTTVQAVSNCNALVSHVCNISKRVKPITMIKKSCSKNVFRLTGNKDTIAYYSKDDVYAIVERKDGIYNVILSPFDTKSLCAVDVDVLSEIQ